MAEQDRQGEVSPELDALVCDLIGTFLDSLAAGEDPGVAVWCADEKGATNEVVFTDDGEEVCMEAARKHVAKLSRDGSPRDHMGPAVRYALATTGYVQAEDGAYEDALLVSFGERGMSTGYSAYLLIDGVGSGEGFSWTEPAPAGEEPLLLAE